MYHVAAEHLIEQYAKDDATANEHPIVLPDAEWDDEDTTDPDREEEEVLPLCLATAHFDEEDDPDDEDYTPADDVEDEDDPDVYEQQQEEEDDDVVDYEHEGNGQLAPVAAEEQPNAAAVTSTFRTWDMPSFEGTEEETAVFSIGLLSHIPLPPDILEDLQDVLVSDHFEPRVSPSPAPAPVAESMPEVPSAILTMSPLPSTTLAHSGVAFLPGSPSSTTSSTSIPASSPADTSLQEIPSTTTAVALLPIGEATVSRKRSRADDDTHDDTHTPKRNCCISKDPNAMTLPSIPGRKHKQCDDDNTGDDPLIQKRRRSSLDANMGRPTTEVSLAKFSRSLSSSPRIPAMNCG
ncbi:hypothetical protein BX666DRAFT_2024152 [Dichotomocladium elegans]|nr:hypothetical protein BX666DRAFT_2024152 [Dichotomocladium elegans]